jgi:hypothetical protein
VNDIVELRNRLDNAPGEPAKEVATKLKRILSRNPGFDKLVQISGLLRGEGELEPNEEEFSLSDIARFKYAPVTSCDVERSFSQYKTVLADNRQSFRFDNLKMYLVVHCNAKI